MPRTKRTALTENIKPNRAKLNQHMINSYLKAVDVEVLERDMKIQSEYKQLLLKFHTTLKEKCVNFPHSSSKTIAELKLEKTELGTLFETTSFKNISVNTTKTFRKVKNSNYTSSAARSEERCIQDASLRSTTQTGIKKAKNTRASRSLSRSKLQQALTALNPFNTPVSHNMSAGTFGLVTPKVKPNIPQVVLRRPKQGEMAISMQGSPLMVSSITSDQKANVNIPLQDGRVLSIQPQRGLRTSQIPDLDAETKRQIETLRDNLNKVCALTARR